MNTLHAIIIDDELSAIKTLKGMLTKYFDYVEILDVATSADQGLELLKEYDPDLVFLDIEMPPMGTGFDFLKKCGKRRFGVIFTTAYPKYAVMAINSSKPWAYLVKPFSIAELTKALNIASENVEIERLNERINVESIIIPDARKGNIVIRLANLLYCKADGATTDLIFQKNARFKTLTASRTLKDVEKQLSNTVFFRSHHGYLVNMQFINSYEKTGRNGKIFLINSFQVPLSVSKKELFEKCFQEFLSRKNKE